jgi:hypothetical protein
MVVRLIVLCLPMLIACAAEGDLQSGPSTAESVAQANSDDDTTVPPEGAFQGGPSVAQANSDDDTTVPPEGAFQGGPSVAQANSDDDTTVPPEGAFQGGPPTAEPSIRFNFEGVMEDVVTASPKGNIQNEPRETE